MKHLKNLILGTIAALALGGCASLPTATYTTAGGCGIAQWTNEFVQASVASMSWTGPCENGLAHGKGTLLVKLKDGKQRHYAGAMEKGGINGDGTYTRETGWKYEGNFLWLTFISGKVYASDGRLVFHGRMAHNENYNGQNITFADQRYFEGALYFTDGSYITDGRYTGSAGPALGIGSIDPKTGKGIVYGKYVKDHQVVYRLVDGKLYPDEIAYLNAQTRYFEKIIAAQDAQNAAFTKAQEERSAKELREAVALLSNAAVAAAGGANTAERMQLATAVLATGSASATGSSSSSATTLVEFDGLGVPSRSICIQTEWISEPVPTGNNLGDVYFGSRGPRDPTGRDSVTDRKLLVATQVCDEDIIFFSATCEDESMLVGGGGRGMWKDTWSIGDLAGVWSSMTNNLIRKGQRIVIAESHVRTSYYAPPNHNPTKTDPVVVAWGAWRLDAITSPTASGGQTEAGKRLGRRQEAIHLELNRATRSSADRVRLGRISANTAGLLRTQRPEVKSCGTADLRAVWNATQ